MPDRFDRHGQRLVRQIHDDQAPLPLGVPRQAERECGDHVRRAEHVGDGCVVGHRYGHMRDVARVLRARLDQQPVDPNAAPDPAIVEKPLGGQVFRPREFDDDIGVTEKPCGRDRALGQRMTWPYYNGFLLNEDGRAANVLGQPFKPADQNIDAAFIETAHGVHAPDRKDLELDLRRRIGNAADHGGKDRHRAVVRCGDAEGANRLRRHERFLSDGGFNTRQTVADRRRQFQRALGRFHSVFPGNEQVIGKRLAQTRQGMTNRRRGNVELPARTGDGPVFHDGFENAKEIEIDSAQRHLDILAMAAFRDKSARRMDLSHSVGRRTSDTHRCPLWRTGRTK